MYNVFTTRKNIYKLRITLKKNKIIVKNLFFKDYVVSYGTARREWVNDLRLKNLKLLPKNLQGFQVAWQIV